MCRMRNRYAQLLRKCDYRTDAGQSDPYVPLCFAGDTKNRSVNKQNGGHMNAIHYFKVKYRTLKDKSCNEMSDDESGSDELSDSDNLECLGDSGLIPLSDRQRPDIAHTR